MRPVTAVDRRYGGPALYIGGFGLVGTIGAIPFPMLDNPIRFVAVVLIGCIAGGLIFRLRARNWPQDPIARQWQPLYVALAMVIPPVAIFMYANTTGQGFELLVSGLFVGVSLAVSIYISGTRRRCCLPSKTAEPT